MTEKTRETLYRAINNEYGKYEDLQEFYDDFHQIFELLGEDIDEFIDNHIMKHRG